MNLPIRHKLSDATIYREIEFEVAKAVDETTRSVEVIASTAALDAHGEVVEQDWDLARYKRNPVILWNHNRDVDGPSDSLPIGRASNVRVEGGKLKMVITFASKEANELAERVWLLVKEGVLKGVSVGFRPGKITTKIANGKEIYVLSECELRETSFVPVGSNPEAVAKAIDDEHKLFAQFVGSKQAPGAKGNQMDIEIQKALAEEKVARESAEKSLKSAEDKIKSLEGELKSEKAVSSKLEAELKTEREKSAASAVVIVKNELDARAGKKFAPAEREEWEALVKEVGIERVCKLLDMRSDIQLSEPVTVDGEPVSGTVVKEKAIATGASAQIASDAAKKAGL